MITTNSENFRSNEASQNWNFGVPGNASVQNDSFQNDSFQNDALYNLHQTHPTADFLQQTAHAAINEASMHLLEGFRLLENLANVQNVKVLEGEDLFFLDFMQQGSSSAETKMPTEQEEPQVKQEEPQVKQEELQEQLLDVQMQCDDAASFCWQQGPVCKQEAQNDELDEKILPLSMSCNESNGESASDFEECSNHSSPSFGSAKAFNFNQMPLMQEVVTINPRRKAGQAQREQEKIEISLEALQALSGLPQSRAAKKLGVCVTVLKKVCRKFGIPNWPYKNGRGHQG